jgi:hypothetical protein
MVNAGDEGDLKERRGKRLLLLKVAAFDDAVFDVCTESREPWVQPQ